MFFDSDRQFKLRAVIRGKSVFSYSHLQKKISLVNLCSAYVVLPIMWPISYGGTRFIVRWVPCPSRTYANRDFNTTQQADPSTQTGPDRPASDMLPLEISWLLSVTSFFKLTRKGRWRKTPHNSNISWPEKFQSLEFFVRFCGPASSTGLLFRNWWLTLTDGGRRRAPGLVLDLQPVCQCPNWDTRFRLRRANLTEFSTQPKPVLDKFCPNRGPGSGGIMGGPGWRWT